MPSTRRTRSTAARAAAPAQAPRGRPRRGTQARQPARQQPNDDDEPPEPRRPARGNGLTLDQQRADDERLRNEQSRTFAAERHEQTLRLERERAEAEIEVIRRGNGNSGNSGSDQRRGGAEDDGEPTPQENELCKLFKRYNKKYVLQIAKDEFHPQNLQYLTDKKSDDEDPDGYLFVDGQYHKKARKGPLSGFKTIHIWSKGYNAWAAIWKASHRDRVDIGVETALMEFHNKIISVHSTYVWMEAVLPLAIEHH